MKGSLMKHLLIMVLACSGVMVSIPGICDDNLPISEATQECLGCHETFHPGIVADWKKSRHAMITPENAMKAAVPARKVSSAVIPDNLKAVVVGCAECHTQNPEAHSDTFSHNGFKVHVVVTPEDCAVCHLQEREQYADNIMAHAWKNLMGNTLYQSLKQSITGSPSQKNHRVVYASPDASMDATTCLYCHGTRLTVTGFEKRSTDAGELEFPVIEGWPNQGVGRINPDGSLGACTSCHSRHSFSMETARKPYTCKECHSGPDVPAYKVYEASKHGNIAASQQAGWNFTAVPWKIGQDFTAPTCAVCHISLLTGADGAVVAQRTHRMNDRLSDRIFGLIYAHRQPKSPDTSIIRNKDGLPLPTDFDGSSAVSALIDDQEFQKRRETMQAICKSCHSTSWVKGHWARYDHMIAATNIATHTATDTMREIWKRGYAPKPDKNLRIFDSAIEKKWSHIWLFDANNARFAAAMAGGGDYSVFAEGFYPLSEHLQEMNDWLEHKGK